MRLRESVPEDLGPLASPQDLVTLFGSPAFVYSELLRTAYRWVEAVCRRKDSFFYANRFRHVLSYIRTSYGMFAEQTPRSAASEVTAFLRTYARKRMSRATARHARA